MSDPSDITTLRTSAPARIAAFVALLGAVFAISTIAGAELDPRVDAPAGHGDEEAEVAAHGGEIAPADDALPGLAVAQSGYRLVPEDTRPAPGARTAYGFRIVDADGETVRDFDLEHERRMHLIVVRRDFAHFQHLHPEQRADGSWMVEADLRAGGVYRAFADFATDGESLTLATDLFVPGEFDPQPLPAPARTANAGDGYRVSLARGADRGDVRFTVTRDGRELDSVEPYLGADGHLVALREHDQAFLHVHPKGEPGGSGPIAFGVEYPTPGTYRLFLQFKHDGQVRAAAFTQTVDGVEEDADGGH